MKRAWPGLVSQPQAGAGGVNLSEEQEAPAIEYQHERSMVVPLQGRLEMDISQLPPDEMSLFLEEYGIEEPSLNRMIRLSYDLLGLLSFLPLVPMKCAPGPCTAAAVAPVAAGEIHSDLQKGFIRAEVISYDELMALGSMNEAKAKGKLRLEGKEYVVQDGDILNIRFHV
jgi:ribosome-binding ATPase